ncbi:TetR/AcrR family transcriptional regulator [Paraconexibacter antarcticus]|uniref:TetR/AcrR family transcriptional regulator n=1 Tax=Paraconexibacter antarcticus TaxID=2949664 RepID=A0ABY5E0N9_9ACTN|nr:TetR/AcrR family transcriptional regulator [Paraconexibacter antarcticus]UTI66764.1 TetR/AcrR family transcriptional regulator [Paraconexibacter antarcticus]
MAARCGRGGLGWLPSDLTSKGQQRATAILEAALRCPARDGFAATSLQRVADEAGLNKRAVIYYYDSREGLFGRVVEHVGGRFIKQLEDTVQGLEDPSDIVERGFETFWAAITTDRALLVARFGLQAESITNPAFLGAARYISTRFRDLVSGLIDDAIGRGRTLLLDRASLEVLILTNVQGLILNYLENGDTPELHTAIKTVQTALTYVSQPPVDSGVKTSAT